MLQNIFEKLRKTTHHVRLQVVHGNVRAEKALDLAAVQVHLYEVRHFESNQVVSSKPRKQVSTSLSTAK